MRNGCAAAPIGCIACFLQSGKSANLRLKAEVPAKLLCCGARDVCLAGSEGDDLSSADPTASEHSLT
jgi:hypothetical protein